jgi:hypothetical protein
VDGTEKESNIQLSGQLPGTNKLNIGKRFVEATYTEMDQEAPFSLIQCPLIHREKHSSMINPLGWYETRINRYPRGKYSRKTFGAFYHVNGLSTSCQDHTYTLQLEFVGHFLKSSTDRTKQSWIVCCIMLLTSLCFSSAPCIACLTCQQLTAERAFPFKI